MKQLADNLKFLRKSRQLKQEDMLDQLGIKAATWSNYENGVSDPSIDSLIEFSKYFRISLDDIVLKDLARDPTDPVKDVDIWQEYQKLREQFDRFKDRFKPPDS